MLRSSKEREGQTTVFVSGQGILRDPHGLAFSPEGDLFIADETSIYRFDANSVYWFTYSSLSLSRRQYYLFNCPHSIQWGTEITCVIVAHLSAWLARTILAI